MPTNIQKVDGSTQWDGTASKGLIDFPDISGDEYWAILSLSFRPGSGVTASTVDLEDPDGGDGDGDGDTCNVQVDVSTTETEIAYQWEWPGLVVPKGDSGASFSLKATSTGKTGDGSLVVVYHALNLEG